MTVAVASQVEPMPGPPLPEPWRREQAIHELFIGLRALIGNEYLYLVAARQQSEQIETQSAKERPTIRLSGWPESLAIHPSDDECIDRIRRVHRPQRRPADRLERPMIALGYRVCF